MVIEGAEGSTTATCNELDLDHDPAMGRVWASFLERHLQVLHEHRELIADDYLVGLSRLPLTSTRVPSVRELDASLTPFGWSLVPVHTFLSPKVFFEHLSARCFPVIVPIRTAHHVRYSPVPDFIHDVLGHLPVLHVEAYTRFVRRLAESYLRAPPCALEDALFDAQVRESTLANIGASGRSLDDVRMLVDTIEQQLHARPSLRSRLRKLYLWTVEFGFMAGRTGSPRAVGAAILSSHDELVRAAEQRKVPLTNEVMLTSYDFTKLQVQYFTFDGWQELESLIPRS